MIADQTSKANRMILASLFLAEGADTFGSTMMFAVLPKLMRELGDPLLAAWLVTGHSLVATGAALMAGRIGAIFGARRTILAFLAVSVLGSVMSAMSESFTALMCGRVLHALGSAVFPLSITILRLNMPAHKVPMGIGLLTSAVSAGSASGLVIGGVITDNLDWHWMFAANAAMMAIAFVAIYLFVPEGGKADPTPRIDWIDGILPIPAISAMLLGVSLTKARGWSDPFVLVLIAVGIAVVWWWGKRSLKLADPFFDLRLLAGRNVALANVIMVLIAMGTMQITFVFTSYVQSPAWTMVGLGLSATVAGLAKLPSNMFSVFAGPFSGWLSQKSGNRSALLAGLILVTVSWLAALSLPETIYHVIVLICGASFGTTILFAAITNTLISQVDVNRTGDVIGAMVVLRGLFIGIGTQIVALILASNVVVKGTASLPSASAFQATMAWIALLSVVAIAVAMFVSKDDKRELIRTEVPS